MTNRLSRKITDEQLNRGVQIESGGDPDARAKTSSAGGLGQFLKGTWQSVGLKHYPSEVRSAGARWVDMRVGKDTAALQLMMMARFWEDNARIMGSTSDGDLYLAHFLGAGGAQKVVRADQSATAVSVCGEKVAAANLTIFYRKDAAGQYTVPVSCAVLRDWAAASMRKRWDAAGRPDWVTKWGASASPPPAEPGVPAETKAAGGAVVLGGGAVVVAQHAGYDWAAIATLGGCAAVIAIALFFIIRAARRSS